ncbi:MAG: glycerol-3-phosphate 1-O-acyltransferase PlsY [Thermoleophilia bacterium]|nr:glycerol-3-phosphate 1-O-acyltransferase PlsY [Thermoleophilia bacterium]
MNQALALALAYLLGSIPFALIAGKLHGVDLREAGSGNLGATNVFRTLGRTAGVAVMVLDIAKGAAAVLVAVALTNNPWPLAAAALAILGHVFPVWTHFKGGKGVAVGAGAMIGLVPSASGVLLVLWILLVVFTRYVSVASIVAALAAAPLAYVFGAPWSYVVFIALAGVFVIYKHRENIVRLVHGDESRIQFGRKNGAAT